MDFLLENLITEVLSTYFKILIKSNKNLIRICGRNFLLLLISIYKSNSWQYSAIIIFNSLKIRGWRLNSRNFLAVKTIIAQFCKSINKVNYDNVYKKTDILVNH